jgi:Flp pilus assembly protein TadG
MRRSLSVAQAARLCLPHQASRLLYDKSRRCGAAAIEFCIVASVLFLIFLGMIEVGRAMMALGAVANAARSAARTGATTAGTYSNSVSAAQTTLSQAGISATPNVTVVVNGVTVTDDATFATNATAGVSVSVTVSVPYSGVSWLPAGTGVFLSSQQSLSETSVLCREG